MKKQAGPSLFDVIEEEEAREDSAKCLHRKENRTETVWQGDTVVRLTMTCDICKRVRGRYPGE